MRARRALARLAYRVTQGCRALAGRIDAVERAAALRWLPEAARPTFLALPGAYQHHHLVVFGRLWATGCRDGEVLAAALLHDAGKIDGRGRVWLWQRVVVVLLGGRPALLARLARAPAPAWRYGFYLHAHHAALGAALATRLGCSPRVAALIAAHQTGDLADPGLALLRAADDGA